MRPDLINSRRDLCCLSLASLSTGCRLPIQRSRRLGSSAARLAFTTNRTPIVTCCRAQHINTLTTAAHYLCTRRVYVRTTLQYSIFYCASSCVAAPADGVRHSRNSIMRLLALTYLCASDRRRAFARCAPRARTRAAARRLESGRLLELSALTVTIQQSSLTTTSRAAMCSTVLNA